MPNMSHDPVRRLNEQHCDDLLAVARTFGGLSDATAASALSVDDTAIRLAARTPSGRVEALVVFADALPGFDESASLRMTFRELVRRAIDRG